MLRKSRKLMKICLLAVCGLTIVIFQNCGGNLASKSSDSKTGSSTSSSSDLDYNSPDTSEDTSVTDANNKALNDIKNIVAELLPASDPSLVQSLFNLYKSGKTLEEIRNAFLASSQAQSVIEQLACNLLSACNDESLNAALENFLRKFPLAPLKNLASPDGYAVLDQYYKIFFGRGPTTAEIAYWANEFATKSKSAVLVELIQVVRGELIAKYTNIFKRAPTNSEIASALNLLAGGMNITDLGKMLEIALQEQNSAIANAACKALNGRLVPVPKDYGYVKDGARGTYAKLCDNKTVKGALQCSTNPKVVSVSYSETVRKTNGPGSCQDTPANTLPSSVTKYVNANWSAVCCAN